MRSKDSPRYKRYRWLLARKKDIGYRKAYKPIIGADNAQFDHVDGGFG
jgi:hypothetical protein